MQHYEVTFPEWGERVLGLLGAYEYQMVSPCVSRQVSMEMWPTYKRLVKLESLNWNISLNVNVDQSTSVDFLNWWIFLTGHELLPEFSVFSDFIEREHF